MKKSILLLAALITTSAMTPAFANQAYPTGHTQQTRYAQLAERWRHVNVGSMPIIRAESQTKTRIKCDGLTPKQHQLMQAEHEARKKAWLAMTPEQQKAAAIRMAATRDTWESMTPAEREKLKKETLKRIEKAREKAKNQQKQ